MQSNKTMTIGIVTALVLLLAASSTSAGLAVEEGKPAGEISLAGTVLSKISYQGRLTDAGGSPLDGTYNLVFQLWDDASAGSQLGADIPTNNVPVNDGLFTVELDVPQDAFNGQGIWLRIQVNGQWLSPRQELLPVPYALSLRPGATISSPGPTALNAANEAGGYGLQGQSQGNIGLLGISGSGSFAPAGMHGVHGKGEGVGVYGEGGHTGVFGNGINVGVRGESSTGSGVHGMSSSGTAIYSEGDLYVTGAFRGDLGSIGGAPFPRPA